MHVQCESRILILFGFLLATGCSYTQPRLAAPKIDSGAPEAAIAKYDANGDGAISGDELKKDPAIKTSLKRVDKNNDGKVTADEIADRIGVWRNSGLGLTRAVAYVRKNGLAVAGAEVTLVPEEYLGANMKPAHGTTDSNGACHLSASSDPREAGVQLGYYRVQVSKKNTAGKETIPARYNTETELGVEIAPDDPNLDHLVFDISA